jgi:hypothetical protein
MQSFTWLYNQLGPEVLFSEFFVQQFSASGQDLNIHPTQLIDRTILHINPTADRPKGS